MVTQHISWEVTNICCFLDTGVFVKATADMIQRASPRNMLEVRLDLGRAIPGKGDF